MIRPSDQLHEKTPPHDAVNKDAPHHLHELFRKFSHTASIVVGSPWAFMIASASIIVWALLGHQFHYSDTWQLIINTSTTIVTFLMVFLIQNTQNRDARAIHLKLDELIRGVKGARNRLVDLENCTDEELEEMEKEFRRVREKARKGHLPRHAGAIAASAQDELRTIAESGGGG